MRNYVISTLTRRFAPGEGRSSDAVSRHPENFKCWDAPCTMSNALGTITEPPNVKLVNRSFGNLVVETSTLHIAQQPFDK